MSRTNQTKEYRWHFIWIYGRLPKFSPVADLDCLAVTVWATCYAFCVLLFLFEHCTVHFAVGFCHFIWYVIVCILNVAQKYMSLMTSREEDIKVVKFKGLQHVETTAFNAGTYLDSNLKKGTSWLWVMYLKDSLLCMHCTRGHPVVNADAPSFFPSSYSTFLPKFAPASPPWKQTRSSWIFNTMCRMVSICIPISFGNLTCGQKVRAVQNFSQMSHLS